MSGVVEQYNVGMYRTIYLTIAHATDVKVDKIDASAIMVHPMIYDSLVKYGEGGEILPCLATEK